MKKTKRNSHIFQIMLISGSLTLTACGGGSDETEAPVDTKQASGTLLVPENTLSAHRYQLPQEEILTISSAECSNVPNGYLPLADTTIEFLDIDGVSIETAQTDNCGLFNMTVPVSTVQLRAESPDNRPLIAAIDRFTNSSDGIASTIPKSAEYKIASIQKTEANTLAITISDTITNKAVIGLPDSAFSISINSSPSTITAIHNALDTADSASVSLVLDASGSMSSSVNDPNGEILMDGNNNKYNRYRVTALAAHTYLDNISANDETSVVVFSSDVSFINDASIASLMTLEDETGNTASYTFSVDGYSTNPSDLRFIIDSYNPYSSLYGSYLSYAVYDQKHPDTPNLIISNYPWGGATSLYDAIAEGLDSLALRTNNRKIMIAMSDGANNSSSNTEATVISIAQAAGIPIYTIAYEEADPETMKNIATQTNATTFIVNGLDLTSAFQSIQTGIVYQYLTDLQDAMNDGDTINLTINLNGVTISRELQL